MLANFHTHTVFCDGNNTPEEIVLAAIEKDFSAIGFSGHGFTPFDQSYCMKDTEAYAREIRRLKEKYKNKIQIYLGVEEDAFAPVDRSAFDYVIGSSHYLRAGGRHLAIDSSPEEFYECLKAFSGNPVRLAEAYYGEFCDYIGKRRPDIIGHFDLITKYDELGDSLFLKNPEYNAIAERAATIAAKSGAIFEVNTGAITRGLRSTAYPAENILFTLRREEARIILSSDSHDAATLDAFFDETKRYLYDIGFRHTYALWNGEFIKCDIK
ncbi:MAG: histidinol-phosphatase HisJ family protein [Clostridia bacterium]|nr:histidinol-phosphatase HisJ family protein [Clostridia bacterium]